MTGWSRSLCWRQVPGTGWVAITEANIDNYAGMYLRSDKPLFTLKAELSPNSGRSPGSPWTPGPRSIAVAGAHDRRTRPGG